jgi:hypothetical protein
MHIAVAILLLVSMSYLGMGPCSVNGWCRSGENEHKKSFLKVLRRDGNLVSTRAKYVYKHYTTFSSAGASDEILLTFDCDGYRVFYHASNIWEDIHPGSLIEVDMKSACRMQALSFTFQQLTEELVGDVRRWEHTRQPLRTSDHRPDHLA